jgi:hypothetical protein
MIGYRFFQYHQLFGDPDRFYPTNAHVRQSSTVNLDINNLQLSLQTVLQSAVS